jgi:pSer/pThr/pTyr-binding forkhead associated (FHA) protein
MNGRLLVRYGNGVLQEFPIQPRLKIGSSAPSDVVVEGDGVLPLHATAEIRDDNCWIKAVGDGRVAVNGQPAAQRALRHLDVITLGDRVHVIFSTSSSALPQPGRAKKVAAAPSPAAVPNVTRAFTREDMAAMFTPPPDDPPSPNTIVGLPPVVTPPLVDAPTQAPKTLVGIPDASPMPSIGTPPSNTIVGLPPGVSPPSFGAEATPTREFAAAGASFVPKETVILQAPAERPINSVRLTGLAGVFEAPLGQSVIGRGTKATMRIDSVEVSRVHAVLIASPDRVTIEDLKSSNGTVVNGVRITGEHVLAEGDLVSFGTIDLRVDFVRLGGG